MGFFFFNLAGFVIATTTALLSWGLVYLNSAGVETFLLLWTGLSGTLALFYDRLDTAEGLRAYYIWMSRRPHRSRLAAFGVPLVFMPALVLIFAVLFPTIDNDPLPSTFFFIVLGQIALFLIVLVLVKYKLKSMRTD